MCFMCFCVFFFRGFWLMHVFRVFLCFKKVKTKEGHVFCVFLCLLYKKRNIVTGKPPMCFMCFCVFFLQGIWVMHVFCVFLCFKKTKKLERARVLCVFVFFSSSKVKTEEGHVFCVFLCLLYKNREI